MNLIDVNAQNAAESGFFCKMSQKKCEGYRRKLEWLGARFAEGLKIRMLDLSQGERGFIEYIPGEFAWRSVKAKDYLFIHCLWVVGASKGKGYAGLLLHECIKDARRRKLKGVAMVTSERNWLVGQQFLIGHGFESVDQAPPSFALLVRRFGKAAVPSFPDNWEARAKRYGRGLTVVRSDQCPYLDDAARMATEAGKERGLTARVVELKSARDVRERAPSPYGVFSTLLNGEVLSYHYLLKKELIQLLDDRLKRPNQAVQRTRPKPRR